MALFGSKKKEVKVDKEGAPRGEQRVQKNESTPVSASIIRRPRLTEKAANLSSLNVYTFDVVQDATKHDVARAVLHLYKVSPVKVNVVNAKGKSVSLRTRRGTGVQNRMRKAYVYLKKGDTIDFAA